MKWNGGTEREKTVKGNGNGIKDQSQKKVTLFGIKSKMKNLKKIVCTLIQISALIMQRGITRK